MKKQPETYASEEEAAELIRGSLIPNPLRLAAMLEKTMRLPLHGKAADCLTEMYGLLQRCETEMRYAMWGVELKDNEQRSVLLNNVQEFLK